MEKTKELQKEITALKRQNKRLNAYYDLAEKECTELNEKYCKLYTQLKALIFTVNMKEALIRDLQEEIRNLKK